MKPMDFENIRLSRRSLFRGSAAIGAGAAIGGLPGLLSARDATARWPNLIEFIDSYVEPGKVANIVISIGMGQAAPEFVARGPLSLGGLTQAGGDSLYRIYSQTKPVTGIATMMLIEDGKLGLDQPLHEILPAFKNMQVQKVYDGGIGPDDLESAKTEITIRHLLTHTAGLGYSIIQNGPIKRAYERAGVVPGQVSLLPLPDIFGRGTPAPSLEAFADELAKLPLVAQPGTKWHYSVSLDLLGRVIEVASGMAFDEFLQTRIFDACGMADTHFTVPQGKVQRLTTNYGVLGGTLLPLDPAAASVYAKEPPFPFGGAGLVSSPYDYDRFQKMLLGFGEIDGRRVMDEATVRLATSDLVPKGAIVDHPFVNGATFGAGGRVALGENAGGFGWGGAAGTLSSTEFARNMRLGLYTQYMPASTYRLMPELAAALGKDLTRLSVAA